MMRFLFQLLKGKKPNIYVMSQFSFGGGPRSVVAVGGKDAEMLQRRGKPDSLDEAVGKLRIRCH